MSLALVNTWTLEDSTGYGPAQANIANTAGNALVAFVFGGSDMGIAGVQPRLAVADDAHNWWVYGGSGGASIAGELRRLDIWVCANAEQAKVVNLTASMPLAGSGGFICEVSGFPQYAQVDVISQASGTNSSSSMSVSPGVSDFMLSATFVAGGFGGTITAQAGWTATSALTVSNGLGGMGSFTGKAAILPAAQAPGSMSVIWSWSASNVYTSVVVGFVASPTAPTQPNPNWPSVKAEAAFGWQPDNETGTMPTWTDITSRCQDEQGQTIMETQRGRDYELTQPEAGTLKLSLNNTDGAFNPQNTASPYYPNVLPETAIRLSAVWQGRTYGLGYFYASKWPQDFPDRQWGVTTLQGTDLLSTISQGSMPSAYAGEVLADAPTSYYPLSEFYDAPHGFIFNNLSRTNQKPIVAYSPPAIPAAQQLQTGVQMGLAGDSGTGIGVTGLTAQQTVNDLAGAFVLDNSLPPLAAGVTIEGWIAPPTASTMPANYTTILTLYGNPQNYPTNTGAPNGMRLEIQYEGSTANQSVTAIIANLYSPAGVLLCTVPGSGNLTSEGLTYFILTISNTSGSTWSVGMNLMWGPVSLPGSNFGNNLGTFSGVLDYNVLGIGGFSPFSNASANLYDYGIGQVAIYPYVLPQSRWVNHFGTGAGAASGDQIGSRIGKLVTWSQLNIPFGVGLYANEPNPLLGNADQIQGSALADAIYATSQDEGGMYYVPATALGELWYAPRQSFYNQTSVYTFGDNGTTEIPYLPATGFDFSDTYLWNIVESQRTISAGTQLNVSNGVGIQQPFSTTGSTAIVEDQASEAQYFPRGPLQLDIETTSDADAADRANWSLAKYKQAQLRANQIMLECASNPSVLFPVALNIEQGDIVTVNRRPAGWAQPISVQCVVQMVQHSVGPDQWDTTLTLSPYFPDGNVLQCDNSGFDLAGATIGW